jgi:hypothetical protein
MVGECVKIELTEAEADHGLHPHSELWVRVLSSYPINPSSDVPSEVRSQIPEGVGERYTKTACAFYSDIWEDDDPERESFGFEQWWIFPARPTVIN